MLRNADKDGDKRLSKEEFQAGLKPDDAPKQPLAGGQPFPGGPPGAKGDPRAFFNRLDANKDGKLSKDELPEQLRENFARLDANGETPVTTGFVIGAGERRYRGQLSAVRAPVTEPELLMAFVFNG